MSNRTSTADDRGITIIEVVVAAAIVTIVASGIMSVVIASVSSTTRSRQRSLATLLAIERLEQLRSLAWGYGEGLAPAAASDLSTDLSSSPPGTAGPGLSLSPVSSLSTSAPGFADYVDRQGQWIGNGASVPAGAAFVRRWRVSRLPGSADALALEVVVAPLSERYSAPDPVRKDDVRLVTVKGRVGR